jgi:hypothetical protein
MGLCNIESTQAARVGHQVLHAARKGYCQFSPPA